MSAPFPSHLVLMKDGGDAAARVATSLLGGPDTRLHTVSAGISHLLSSSQASPDSPPLATIYHTFGVAALSLDAQAMHQVSAGHPDVLAIVPNEILTIPEPDLRTARLGSSQPPTASDPESIADKYASKADALTRRSGRLRRHLAPDSLTEAVDPTASSLTWPLNMIGLRPDSPLTGRDVGLCVIDTGLDLDHPDFCGRVAAKDARSFVGGTVQDIRGHGTHCAGNAAGPADTALGKRYGVACDSRLLVAKVFSDKHEGASTSDILAAMEWSYERGARILSMSLGSERDPGSAFSATYERVASILLNRNILVVAAAGNESQRSRGHVAPVGNPAACPSVLAVAAVERNGAVSDFSCGAADDIGHIGLAAPGGHIQSAVPGGGYQKLSGTSMACPHVAGLAALHMQAHPGASASEIQQLMQQAAAPRSPQSDFGHGLIQAP